MQPHNNLEVADITTITIQLNELRSRFDQGMREGSEPAELRITYQHMKELECHLKALQWEPERNIAAASRTWA